MRRGFSLAKAGKWLDSFVRQGWWVALFLLGCYAFFEKGLAQQRQVYGQLLGRVIELEEGRATALKHQEDLRLQIQSQSDPAWVELTLMRVLGMTPEGSCKIVFQPVKR